MIFPKPCEISGELAAHIFTLLRKEDAFEKFGKFR